MIGRRLALAAPLARPWGHAGAAHPVPEVPTLREAGVPRCESASWVAVFVPARSPPAAGARLNREIRAVLDSEEGRGFSLRLGLASSTGTPEDLARFQAREIAQWGLIAEAANLPRE